VVAAGGRHRAFFVFNNNRKDKHARVAPLTSRLGRHNAAFFLRTLPCAASRDGRWRIDGGRRRIARHRAHLFLTYIYFLFRSRFCAHCRYRAAACPCKRKARGMWRKPKTGWHSAVASLQLGASQWRISWLSAEKQQQPAWRLALASAASMWRGPANLSANFHWREWIYRSGNNNENENIKWRESKHHASADERRKYQVYQYQRLSAA